ncbi:uncharacterized protein LOC132902493 [Amyelois transitella]|uniref:uncharacterized protein LOC132902493 n=1 Tax=Amyelois transitella TaxID=680683 RepID=UPI00298F994C|nr:uncharacterized protein LOC132902493 [Amyelois transitella]
MYLKSLSVFTNPNARCRYLRLRIRRPSGSIELPRYQTLTPNINRPAFNFPFFGGSNSATSIAQSVASGNSSASALSQANASGGKANAAALSVANASGGNANAAALSSANGSNGNAAAIGMYC